ncbi:MAG: alpha/beta hydrolase family protein [Acidimicrobiales bacterium]
MRTDHELEFEWQGLTLTGTLSLPDGEGPHPVVVMMQGSGSADRHCDGYFAPIRDAFLARGLATYAFDKPGCGRSSGDWRDHPLMARADQTEAAIAALRAGSAVDPGRVGVWGQSQGGWMAQILATRDLDLAFAIANSGPSIGVVEQNLYAVEHTMDDAGRPEIEITEALAFLDRVHEAAAAGRDAVAIERDLLDPVRDTAWYRAQYEGATSADWAFLWRLIEEDYRPLEALGQIDRSFLAIYGGADLLVPAWRGAEETGRALQAGGTSDAAVLVFPGADHRIKDPDTDRFAAGYLDLLGEWAAARLSEAATEPD